MPSNGSGKSLTVGIVLGVVLVAVFMLTMQMTDQRPFCATCHVMQGVAATHKLGSHADLSCNDCHAPHNLAAKLPVKAKWGLHDFFANLSGKDAPVQASKDTRDTVNANCKSCHATTNVNVASMDAKPYCVDCHRSVAHMRKTPLSTRMVAYE